MKKVLHFVNKMDRAGQETFIMNIYRNIDRGSIQFGFLCADQVPGEYDDEIISLGGSFGYISLNKHKGKLRHISNFFIMCKTFKKYIGEYDVFHIHTYHAFDGLLAAVASKIAGYKKVIVHSHSAYADGHFKLHAVAREFLKKMKIIKLACSEDAGKWLFDDESFLIIQNGIEVEKFDYNQQSRVEIRKKMSIDSHDFVVGHVGRFDDVKNQMFLAQLFSRYQRINSNSKLLLIGEGVNRSKIEQFCMNEGVMKNVLFTGTQANTYDLYQIMDVFVFPSLYEGLGIAAIEAETSGLPCVVSDTVPKEIDICSSVKYLSLDSPMDVWIEEIDKTRDKISKRSGKVDIVRNAGYDVKTSVEVMQNVYLES